MDGVRRDRQGGAVPRGGGRNPGGRGRRGQGGVDRGRDFEGRGHEGGRRGDGRYRGATGWNGQGDHRNAGDGATGNQARGPRVTKPLGYKTLEQLLEKNPDEAAIELGSLKLGLQKLLEWTDVRYDVITLLFQVLHHICNAQVSRETVNMLLDMLGRTDFLSKVLPFHLIKMRRENDRNRLGLIPKVIRDIARVLSEVQQRFPSHWTDVAISATLLQDVITFTEGRNIVVDDTIKDEVRRTIDFQVHIEKEKERKMKQYVDRTDPPPEDFRELSIFPTSEELRETTAPPYLRVNKGRGKYDNVDHYLDVQFRLLREDFVQPLRQGISEYKRVTARPGKQNKRFQDIRLYYDVTLEEPLYSQSGVTFKIHFDEKRLKGVRWQASKRLIFGSLVILSPDNFQTLIFGTVANRKPEELTKGFIEIKLERDGEIAEIFSDKTFIMAESSAYFEAYRHVLHRLQEVTQDSMPLTKYIVSAERDIQAPAYIGHNDTAYDLTPLLSHNAPNAERTKLGLKNVRVLNERAWRRIGDTGLNESQLRAVQAALTQEMAVIQGPPGTGKTYIGLKIVRTLLVNNQVWREAEDIGANMGRARSNKPILIVCYTNHALDQFLEGIVEYQPEGVVRVGGRSSCEALKRFNLNSLRRSKLREETPRHVRRRIGEVRGEIETLGTEVKAAQSKINTTKKGLLHEDVISAYMSAEQYNSLTNNLFNSQESQLVRWLLGDMRGMEGMVMEGEQWAPDETQENAEDENDGEEELLDILEEADLLEEMRMLDFDDTAPRTNDGGVDTGEEDLAFRARDFNTFHQGEWQQDPRNRRNMKRNFERRLRSTDRMSDEEARAVRNVWAIRDGENRWRLYRFWIHKHRQESYRRLIDMQRKFTDVCQELREARSQEDFEILRHASIIGMTTTGAAKFHMLLQRIQPRIVVVEEAAEVLEAHIVTALTESCQHLILIGDHQQLKPNPTVYKLAKQFHLDLSLFERMINNNVCYQQLTVQHRMRPEISRLMKMNALYPDLVDDESVKTFDDIRGVTKNIYLIHHEEKEDSADEMKSHSNTHEAKFLVRLCRYFLQQGYLPEKITILTTYAGQLFAFKQRMKKADFEGVRVATVDNFQGEENDIILLSLVRSNKEGSAGFLKIDNRTCVALSRARKGLYCIGNFTLLAGKDGSNLWRDIVKYCKANGRCGTSLELQCENHPETHTKVAKEQDFAQVPEGGCSLPCEARLPCGHVCRMPCHPMDKSHEIYKCQQKCTKVICPMGHRCRKLCYDACDKKCMKKVEKLLRCGHMQLVHCYKEISEVTCESPCSRSLNCGHQCQETCGKNCTSKCEVLVTKRDWPCRHVVQVMCSAEPESCPEPCPAILSCDHQCKGTCGDCHRGRLHTFCREKCGRILVCGHPCRATCAADCPPCKEKCANRCPHSKCQKTCGEPCPPCAEACIWRCAHSRCRQECGQPCDRRPCTQPCTKRLPCGHPCIGLCGEQCPTKCRICNKEEVTEIFFGDEDEEDARFVELEDCKHVIEVQALDQWMKTETGGQNNSTTIKLKECPRCKTPIRRNLRYGDIIKRALGDIEGVKKKSFGEKRDIERRRRALDSTLEVETEMMGMLAVGTEPKLFPRKEDAYRFRNVITPVANMGQVTAVANRVDFLMEVRKTFGEIALLRSFKQRDMIDQLNHALQIMQRWLCQEPIDRMSQQQAEDANREVRRVLLGLKLVKILGKYPRAQASANAEVQEAKALLFHEVLMTPDRERTIKKLLEKIQVKSGGLAISEKERKDIVAALGYRQGHWFKCPNGHIYLITECGGATQESKCPECGRGIGGTGHRLRGDNQLAPEMDGAQYAAYSEEAFNMRNFNLNDLH